MFFIKLFYTICLVGSGILILKYRKTVHDWTGNFVWAERYLGRGGTYLVILFIGLALIFYGVTYPFGGVNMFIEQ